MPWSLAPACPRRRPSARARDPFRHERGPPWQQEPDPLWHPPWEEPFWAFPGLEEPFWASPGLEEPFWDPPWLVGVHTDGFWPTQGAQPTAEPGEQAA